MKSLEHYRTLVFDCDGVVLDSNRVKTEAFHAAALPYGEEAAAELVAYHVAHGGISRYRKFEYLLQQILGRQESPEELQMLLQRYADLAAEGDHTAPERLALLEEHRVHVVGQMEELQANLDHLDRKIAWYRSELRRG